MLVNVNKNKSVDIFTTNDSIKIQAGATALMSAAGGGHASLVTLLLDAKADVNHADNVRHYLLSMHRRLVKLAAFCS
jgi:ankyrin repeat protein